jgi:hypothetical protein
VSFGQAIKTAVRQLQTEGKLPPTLRAVERDKLVIDKLRELGHDTRHGPSRWTLARHLADLAVVDACTLCTLSSDAARGILTAEDLHEHEGDQMEEARPQALQEITQAVRQWLLTVPHDHGLDQALHPQYLSRLAILNNRPLKPGDLIQVRPVTLVWYFELLVVSVVKAPPSVAAKLIRPPMFLLATANRSAAHAIDQLNQLQHDYSLGQLSQAEYELRSGLLQNLRDNGGRYPVPLIADLLSQLNRALDANLLTRSQHATAQQELLAALSEAQLDELNAMIAKSVAAEAPAEKAKKKPALAPVPTA